jgi:hypothetical protein
MTISVCSNLCAVLVARGDVWEAEALLRWQLRLVARVHGRASPEAREVAQRIGTCFESTSEGLAQQNEHLIADGPIGSCGTACRAYAKTDVCPDDAAQVV